MHTHPVEVKPGAGPKSLQNEKKRGRHTRGCSHECLMVLDHHQVTFQADALHKGRCSYSSKRCAKENTCYVHQLLPQYCYVDTQMDPFSWRAKHKHTHTHAHAHTQRLGYVSRSLVCQSPPEIETWTLIPTVSVCYLYSSGQSPLSLRLQAVTNTLSPTGSFQGIFILCMDIFLVSFTENGQQLLSNCVMFN